MQDLSATESQLTNRFSLNKTLVAPTKLHCKLQPFSKRAKPLARGTAILLRAIHKPRTRMHIRHEADHTVEGIEGIGVTLGLLLLSLICGTLTPICGGCSDDITSSLAHAHVDWRETETAHVFRADLPGVRKEDLKVEVEDNKILQISGERVKEKEDQNDKWHRVERQCGSFMRRFRLPEDANAGQIGCTLENGVLTLTVPKLEMKPENKNVRQIDVA
ncbi:hypothetical protein VNO77_33947 [Canavalia gladiata]|uniref:SHSP domain-containing protein n=1 Tax=Canavalia gladiata TaxID=3824 RepID=A0AAN9KFF1_CANGL